MLNCIQYNLSVPNFYAHSHLHPYTFNAALIQPLPFMFLSVNVPVRSSSIPLSSSLATFSSHCVAFFLFLHNPQSISTSQPSSLRTFILLFVSFLSYSFWLFDSCSRSTTPKCIVVV